MKSVIVSRNWDWGERLKGVHPSLISTMVIACDHWAYKRQDGSFVRFTSGVRTHREQRELVKSGKSNTMRSYHLYGHAVDVALFPRAEISWHVDHYRDFNESVQFVANAHQHIVTWGGDWPIVDAVHFQIELPHI